MKHAPALADVLASLSAAPPAAQKAQPRPLSYGVTIFLGSERPNEFTVDPDLLLAAQADPSAYAAPSVVKVTLIPPPPPAKRKRKPAPPEPTFGEMMRAAAEQG